jgi:hypothetical protein
MTSTVKQQSLRDYVSAKHSHGVLTPIESCKSVANREDASVLMIEAPQERTMPTTCADELTGQQVCPRQVRAVEPRHCCSLYAGRSCHQVSPRSQAGKTFSLDVADPVASPFCSSSATSSTLPALMPPKASKRRSKPLSRRGNSPYLIVPSLRSQAPVGRLWEPRGECSIRQVTSLLIPRLPLCADIQSARCAKARARPRRPPGLRHQHGPDGF